MDLRMRLVSCRFQGKLRLEIRFLLRAMLQQKFNIVIVARALKRY
jgi:hypothetical protein